MFSEMYFCFSFAVFCQVDGPPTGQLAAWSPLGQHEHKQHHVFPLDGMLVSGKRQFRTCLSTFQLQIVLL
jgi:hypothetical protein